MDLFDFFGRKQNIMDGLFLQLIHLPQTMLNLLPS